MTTADLYNRDTYSPPLPPPPPQLAPIPPPRRTRSPLLRRLSSRNSNRRQDSTLRRSGYRSSQYRQSGTYYYFQISINILALFCLNLFLHHQTKKCKIKLHYLRIQRKRKQILLKKRSNQHNSFR